MLLRSVCTAAVAISSLWLADSSANAMRPFRDEFLAKYVKPGKFRATAEIAKFGIGPVIATFGLLSDFDPRTSHFPSLLLPSLGFWPQTSLVTSPSPTTKWRPDRPTRRAARG